MGFIDYKKAYDIVPHGWINEAIKMMGIAGNIVNLIESSKET